MTAGVDRHELRQIIAGLSEGVILVEPDFSRGLIEKLANLRRTEVGSSDVSAVNLTVRERQILNLICAGLDDAAIARKLDLSRNTVRDRGAALYRKIGVHKRSEAVVWGRENGFPLHVSGTK